VTLEYYSQDTLVLSAEYKVLGHWQKKLSQDRATQLHCSDE